MRDENFSLRTADHLKGFLRYRIMCAKHISSECEANATTNCMHLPGRYRAFGSMTFWRLYHEEVSKKANIPFGYFFLEKTPIENCKIVEYRTVDSLAIQELSRIKISSISWSRLDSNYKKQIIAHPSICIFLYSNHSLISFIRDT